MLLRRSHAVFAALGVGLGAAITLFWKASEFDATRPSRRAPAGLAMHEPAEQMASRARPALQRPDRVAAGVALSPVPARPIVVEGRVLDEQDLPVGGALVYALPKGVAGAHDPTSVPNVATTAEGAFRLVLHDVRQCWIGALAAGRLPAWLDGDTIDAAAPHVLRLRLGGIVKIITRDRLGGLGTTAFVRVESLPRNSASPLPAPGVAPFTVVTGTTENAGEVVLRVGTTGPVLVRAVRWGYVSIPDVVHLDQPVGEVVFEFQESCGLHVLVSDKSTRLPLQGWFSLHVVDSRTGSLANGAAASNRFGEYELRDRLPPGEFDVKVSSKGYRDWVGRGVRLVEPGRSHTLVVELEPDPTVGDLLLRVPSLVSAFESAVGRGPPMPRVLWRRSSGLDSPWDFIPDLEVGSEPATYRIRGVPEGTYDFLLCMVEDRGVALLRDLSIKARTEVEVSVALAQGQDIELGDGLAGSVNGRVARVEFQDDRTLPCIRLEGASITNYGVDDDVGRSTVLGPYPVGRLKLRLRLRDGTERVIFEGARQAGK